MKKGTKKEASQLINAKIPDVTSENGSAHASTTKIPQTLSAVKTSDKNSSPSDNSQNQPRETREYTDRELLADALDSVATSEEDRKKLTQYKKKVADADELERTLAELRAKKKALEEAKAKRSEIRLIKKSNIEK